jgi:hypothetical protein
MKLFYNPLGTSVSRKFIAAVATITLVATSAFAQISTYSFSSAAGTYTAITGGSTLGIPTNDDDVFGNLPIGFSFCYNGTPYTSFGVNANGWINMGTATPANSYTALSTGATNNVISAFNFDLQGEAVTGELRYQTIGTAPNRTLVVQWTNYDAWQSATNTDTYNFQIRLNETSNTIEVVYGSYTVNAGFRGTQVGLRGATNADFNNREVSNGINTWATSTAGLTNAAIAEVNNTPLVPASGLTYTWTPPTAPAPPINMTFTAVTVSGMTVNWDDNSTNEAGFRIYRSVDNVVFTQVGNVTSTSIATTGTAYNYVAGGLFSNTLYYWRVEAYNAACGGTFLTGQQSTLAGTLCGTYSIGPTGAYTSLTAAVAAVVANGIQCPLIFEFQAAYVSAVETFPITIPFLGAGPATSITCRPELGATNISVTSGAAQTILMNGSTYWTFDGRPGGVGTNRELSIENTSATGIALQLIGDASNNGATYCNLRGVNTSTTQGVVVFGNATTSGNNANAFTNNNFTSGITRATNLVYASNAAGLSTGNTFTNNNFFDYGGTATASSAFTITGGNSAWIISNNNFYQTITRTFTGAVTHWAINVNSTTANVGSFTISGNFIGGSAPACAGTWTDAAAVAQRFIAINVTATAGGTNLVQNNTIAGFNFTTTSGATTVNGVWCAINSTGTGCSMNISGNTIGTTTGTGSIVTSVSTSGGLTVGWNNSASGAHTVTNNTIGGITANSSSATTSSSFIGMQTSSGISTITLNTIGSTTVTQNIVNAASTGATGGHVTGILSSAFVAGTVISGNTIMNLHNNYAGTSTTGQIRGIVVTSGSNTITNNGVSNLTTMSNSAGVTTTSAVLGISCQSGSALGLQTISGNTILNLAALTPTAATQLNGILVTSATSVGNNYLVIGNNVRAIGAPATSGNAITNGIQIYGGTGRVYNNMIGLGLDATGTSITTAREYNGINKNTANRSTIIFNTVSIDGTGVATGTANTFGMRRLLSPAAAPADSIYNNIFSNKRSNSTSGGTHYGIGVNNTTQLVANANNYYGNGTGYMMGLDNVTQHASVASWNGATTLDANSFGVDPVFVSATNLHINSVTQTPLESRAIPMGVNTDYDLQARPGPVGSVNGGGTVPDIGADEFDGFPVNVDLGIQLLVTPLTSGCHGAADTIRVRLRNYATSTIDLSVNNVTINGSVGGPNPVVLGPLVVSSGTIPAGGTMDINLLTNYNMTAAGTYVFNASSSQALDFVTSNDAMAAVNIVVSGGTYVAASGGELCLGDNANLVVTGYTNGGSIQWQSSPDNLVWTNIVGATTTPYSITPSDTTFYRAVICGLHMSSVDTLFPELVTPAVTVGDTICGVGTVTLTASGSGTLNWYDASTGGNQVNTGTTYSPTIAATDTFYVENTSGTPPSTHTTTFAAGNGSSGNAFTVRALNTITVTSFDGHLSSVAGTPSTWEIWYRPNDYLLTPGSHLSNVGWTQLGTATTPSAGPGVPTVIPIPLTLQIPAGQTYSFQIFTTTGAVSYTNGTVLGALYNANTDLEVYQGHGGTAFAGMVNQPRVFNGIIHYAGGCASTRTPVIAVVNTPPAVTATSSNNICGSGSSTLIASSVNPNYGYVWSPAGTLNTPNGDTVIASPTSNTMYLVTATDPSTGCTDTASVLVQYAIAPQVNATVSNDTVCANTAVNLNVAPTFANPAIVGTNNILNTSTSYPAPYGQFYWGSKHQMLVTAADLTAAGLSAGYINALSFEVTNTNTSAALTDFEIKMATTAVTAITTFQTPTWTSVFYTPSYAPTTGVNTHTFSTAFFWDGVSNILVETCHNNIGGFTTNCTFRQTATSYSSVVYYRADAAGVCANMAVTASIAQRPNMRFWKSAAYMYDWAPIANVSNPNIANPVGTPTVSGDFIVTVTDSLNGCITLDSVYVMVNPNPAPAFGPDTVICSNASLLLDGTAGPYNYLWQDNSTNQTFTVNAFGTYNVAVTDSITGCMGTDTILVGINAAPSFTLGSDATVCQGTQVSFSGPSGQYAYIWNTSDTTISITTGTAGTYDLAVTDTLTGCSSMDTVMLTVNPVPAVGLGSDTSVCSANGSVTLSGPAGNYEYLWSTSDTTMSISVSSTGNYYVLVTDTVTSCFSGDTVFITYNISPVANLGNDTTFCSANGPITLVAPSGSNSYVWNDMSTGMTLQAGTTGLYYVDVLDTISGCTATDSIMVTVPASPSFVLSDTSLCGTQYTITGPAGSYMYDWSTLDSTQSITVFASGTYTLTVTDSASGCTGTDVSTVNINANPTVTASASDLTPCLDDANVILTGGPVGGTFTGTSVTGNQFDPSVGAGTYVIVYNFTDVNGCSGSDSLSVVVDPCVGVIEPVAGAGMNVYPNPNTGKFTFFAAEMNCAEMTIEVTTVEGQTIYSNQYSNVQGNFTQEINMAEFANGVYFMRVTTDGAVFTQRVVKQE